MGGQHLQYGYARQRDEQDGIEQDGARFQQAIQNDVQHFSPILQGRNVIYPHFTAKGNGLVN